MAGSVASAAGVSAPVTVRLMATERERESGFLRKIQEVRCAKRQASQGEGTCAAAFVGVKQS